MGVVSLVLLTIFEDILFSLIILLLCLFFPKINLFLGVILFFFILLFLFVLLFTFFSSSSKNFLNNKLFLTISSLLLCLLLLNWENMLIGWKILL